jgi:hypothetical protein
MTPEEIRKLLGGYATNSLTADERKNLFEAALDDQALFNAIENEDALRELIDDPVSRNRLREALQGPQRQTRRPSVLSRRWVLGMAIPAVAAVIVIAVMNRTNAPGTVSPIPQNRPANIASTDVASNREAVPPEAIPEIKKPEIKKKVEVTPNAAPRQVAPPQVQLDAAQNGAAPGALGGALPSQAFQQQSQGMSAQQTGASLASGSLQQIPDAIRQQFSAGFAANIPLYQGPLVRYSLLRSGPGNDEVRVEVSTSIAGYLALYKMDSARNLQREFPANDLAVLVLPDVTTQIPANPIKVGDASEKLRLVIIPANTPPAFMDRLAASATKAVEKTTTPAPLVVDIALGKN